jgi:hypothetical protein
MLNLPAEHRRQYEHLNARFRQFPKSPRILEGAVRGATGGAVPCLCVEVFALSIYAATGRFVPYVYMEQHEGLCPISRNFLLFPALLAMLSALAITSS